MDARVKVKQKTVETYIFNDKEYHDKDSLNAAIVRYDNNRINKITINHVDLNQTADFPYYGDRPYVWGIYDEGPVDYGSNGTAKLLTTVHGVLTEVIKYAVTVPGFFGYGPGTIRRVNVVIL